MTETGKLTDLNKEMLARKNYPRNAFLLSVIGGTLILIQGFMVIFFRSVIYALIDSLDIGLETVLIGIMLFLAGLIIDSSAASLVYRPDRRRSAGGMIILFSLISLFFGGGYIIGSILGMVGGILAITWRGSNG
ncbi:MAG: DUF6114 domain-containing protein [Methanomassiliicoccus sp.]|nr:DUF6114 domain-containing protein [Methanomassiliicoccus sp.]